MGKEETERVCESRRALVSKGQLPGRHRSGKSGVGWEGGCPRRYVRPGGRMELGKQGRCAGKVLASGLEVEK